MKKTSIRRQTSSQTFRLRAAARYVIVPKGVVSTEWPRIERTAKAMGITYDPWQQAVGKLLWAKNGYVNSEVGIRAVSSS